MICTHSSIVQSEDEDINVCHCDDIIHIVLLILNGFARWRTSQRVSDRNANIYLSL